jgi:membrane protein required for colicin V production
MLSILVTFLLVLWGVQLLGRAMTTAVDVALLSLPNKLAGLFFGVVKGAFFLSVLLNLSFGLGPHGFSKPVNHAADHSALAGPLRSFAPLLVPALRETKWMKRAVDRVQEEVEDGM